MTNIKNKTVGDIPTQRNNTRSKKSDLYENKKKSI